MTSVLVDLLEKIISHGIESAGRIKKEQHFWARRPLDELVFIIVKLRPCGEGRHARPLFQSSRIGVGAAQQWKRQREIGTASQSTQLIGAADAREFFNFLFHRPCQASNAPTSCKMQLAFNWFTPLPSESKASALHRLKRLRIRLPPSSASFKEANSVQSHFRRQVGCCRLEFLYILSMPCGVVFVEKWTIRFGR